MIRVLIVDDQELFRESLKAENQIIGSVQLHL